MARLSRLTVPGEVHQVVQRGHNRQPVFTDDTDRQAYLDALRDAAREHRLAVHGYVLLDSEIALLATPSDAQGLSRTLQAVGRRYVAAFNRRHSRSGTLWEGRFRAAVMESERYFLPALCQLEAAPVDAGLVVQAADWRWSSASAHVGGVRDALLTEHPLYWALGNTPFDREATYRRLMEQGVPMADRRALAEATLRSWALGSPAYLGRLAQQTERPLAARPRGRPKKPI